MKIIKGVSIDLDPADFTPRLRARVGLQSIPGWQLKHLTSR